MLSQGECHRIQPVNFQKRLEIAGDLRGAVRRYQSGRYKMKYQKRNYDYKLKG